MWDWVQFAAGLQLILDILVCVFSEGGKWVEQVGTVGEWHELG